MSYTLLIAYNYTAIRESKSSLIMNFLGSHFKQNRHLFVGTTIVVCNIRVGHLFPTLVCISAIIKAERGWNIKVIEGVHAYGIISIFFHIFLHTYVYALPFEGHLGNAWSGKTIWEGLLGLASRYGACI